MDSTSPGQVGLGYIRKVAEPEPGSELVNYIIPWLLNSVPDFRFMLLVSSLASLNDGL